MRSPGKLCYIILNRAYNFCLNLISIFKHSFFTVSILGSSWHVAETVITSAYRALSKELITAELGAYVGLGHVNITLCGK